jgi:sugar phosphate isomerase/epimerase
MGNTSYPFKLGTTSYIIQGDLVTNAKFLSEYVQDVELVLFDTGNITNVPNVYEISQLKALKDQTGIGYTVHFPIDKKAGCRNAVERIAFSESAQKIIDITLPLEPRAYILHLEGITPDATVEDIAMWNAYTKEVIETLCLNVNSEASIAIENLGYPWYWHLDNAAQAGTSLCCDIGHLWLYFPDVWKLHFEAMLLKTTVIHLHGVSNVQDHISLKYHDPEKLYHFFDVIRKNRYSGVITLEIFSKDELFESLEIVNETWKLF